MTGGRSTGWRVLGAYATSSVSGWTVHVGVPTETVSSQGRRAVEAVAAGSLVSVMLAALLVWAVHRELSERRARAAELALADSGARLQAVVETAADGIVTIDEAGRIETVNPAVGRMFGHAPEELHRPQRVGADAGAASLRARRLPGALRPHRRAADHRHQRPRGRGPAQGRGGVPARARGRGEPPARAAPVHRHAARHHGAQAGRGAAASC